MIEAKEIRYTFKIREVGDKEFEFRAQEAVLYEYDALELLAERAANVYFFGHGGHLCDPAWPLMFEIYTGRGLLGVADVYLEDGGFPPNFGIIPKGGG